MVICAIVGCGNQSNRDKGKSFFRLPSVISHQGSQTQELSKRRQDAWLAKIKRDDLCQINTRTQEFVQTILCVAFLQSSMMSTIQIGLHL